MKIKKIIALLVALASVFALAACGNTQTGVGGSGEQVVEVADEEWAAGATAEGGNVTIRYATWRENDRPYYEEIIRRFQEKYPWITVDLKITSNSSAYYNYLQSDFMDGSAPDVFDVHPTSNNFATYVSEGLLAPQTDFNYVDNYLEQCKRVTTFDDQVYGYVQNYNFFGFVYNKAIFQKVGVEPPKTPEELVEVVNKLKEAGYGGIAFEGGGARNAIAQAAVLGSLGTDGYSELTTGLDNGTITDVTQIQGMHDALNAVELYRDENVFYDGFEGSKHEAAVSLFAQQKAAIVYIGTYAIGEKDYYFPGIDVGYFPVPTYANDGTGYVEGGHTSCINVYGENKGAAKLWIEFLATPEISEYYCSNAKMMSTLQGVTPVFDEAEELMAAVQTPAFVIKSNFSNYEYWSNGLGKVLEAALYSEEGWEANAQKLTEQLVSYDLANK